MNESFFGIERYSAFAYSLSHEPTLIVLYIIAYSISGASILFMGSMLFITRNKSHILLSAATRGLYGTLGILLGLCFFSKMATIFIAIYWIDVAVAMATAGVAASTAALTTRESMGLKQPGDV